MKQLSLKTVKEQHSDYSTLISAVYNNIGKDSIEDVTNHGMESGFGSLIYYSDTHRFAMRHRKAIIALLEEQADQLGEEVVQMVSGFGVFRRSPMDNEDRKELYKYLGGGRCEQSTITNLMAWFAAEEVCRWFFE